MKLGCGTLKIWRRKGELLDGVFLLFYPKIRFRVGFSVLLEMLLQRLINTEYTDPPTNKRGRRVIWGRQRDDYDAPRRPICGWGSVYFRRRCDDEEGLWEGEQCTFTYTSDDAGAGAIAFSIAKFLASSRRCLVPFFFDIAGLVSCISNALKNDIILWHTYLNFIV